MEDKLSSKKQIKFNLVIEDVYHLFSRYETLQNKFEVKLAKYFTENF